MIGHERSHTDESRGAAAPQNLPSICFRSDCIAAGPPIILSMCGGSIRDICTGKGAAYAVGRQPGQ